jgi:DNA polymerase (family 10)
MPNNIQVLTNAEIADRLSTLAQLLSMEKANPYKIKAYRRAANTIRALGESVDELVRSSADLTVYSGIGEAISGAVREIVLTGTLGSLEKLRSNASPELLSISTIRGSIPNESCASSRNFRSHRLKRYLKH